MRSLKTSRLHLTPLRASDAAELFVIRGDPQAMEYWDGPPDHDAARTREIVSGLLRDVASSRALYWTVRQLIDNRFVGLCDLSDIEPHRSADLGFMITPALWGQGLAHEACEALITEARVLDLQFLSARIHARNERSLHLLQRLSFRETGLTAQLEIRPGVRRDCRHFTLSLH